MNLKTNELTSFREMCYRCLRPNQACFCKNIEPLETRSHFLILMHPKEAKSGHVGTGRLSHLSLKNSTIIIDESFDHNVELREFLENDGYEPFLLYPGEESINLSDKNRCFNVGSKAKSLFIIVDGTWPCAKSMMRRSKILQSLKRVSFTTSRISSFEIRQQPDKFCLSTIESIYVLLGELEKRDIEKRNPKTEVLLETLKKLVDFQKECASNPNLQHYGRSTRPYKKPSERVISERWSKRLICFEDRKK